MLAITEFNKGPQMNWFTCHPRAADKKGLESNQPLQMLQWVCSANEGYSSISRIYWSFLLEWDLLLFSSIRCLFPTLINLLSPKPFLDILRCPILTCYIFSWRTVVMLLRLVNHWSLAPRTATVRSLDFLKFQPWGNLVWEGLSRLAAPQWHSEMSHRIFQYLIYK